MPPGNPAGYSSARGTASGLQRRIIDEVVSKVEDYEGNMTTFMADTSEAADLYKVKRPKRKSKAFSNPRLTEFHRACNAVGTLMYRMMTAQEPFFAPIDVDMNADHDRLQTITHAMLAQLKYAKYKRALLKSCMYVLPFGTVIAQEDFEIVGVNAFGRRIPVTKFRPRVMDQVAFDRSTIEIDDASWLATMDVTSAASLLGMIEDIQVGAAWNKSALEEAAKDREQDNTINSYVLQRLQRAGYVTQDAFADKKELLAYYGKLDCMADNVEYVVFLVNRKHLVRFHANNFQHGKRPFRVAKWIDFDSSLGLGYGSLFGHLHRSMDANRQKAQDNLGMASYNMWTRKKNTVADEDCVIRPLSFIDVDDHDDIKSLQVSTHGAEGALKLEEMLKQEFRAATLATDTLQAVITEATASEVTLAMNESLRNISVKAEHIAESLVREHLEACHSNNAQYIRQPFNINKAGVAARVYPADLKVDLDFDLKMTTDRDFKPQRLEKLIQTLQILTSTKSQYPEQFEISVFPLVRAIAGMLDVPAEDILRKPTAPPVMGAGDIGGMGEMTIPGGIGGAGDSSVAVLGTPVGPALASP